MVSTRLPTVARAAKDGVRDRAYRERLQSNGITMLDAYKNPPKHIQDTLKNMLPAESVTITGDLDTAENRAMAISGVDEDLVKHLFQSLIRDRIDRSRLKFVGNKMLDSLRVPNIRGRDRISTPKPDVYLGYRHETFDNELQGLLGHYDRNHVKFAFLGVELKGDDETTLGGLWIATNQCMGGAATFLNIQNRLQSTLRDNSLVKEADALKPVVFSVASNGTEARLFATYSEGEGNFTMHFIRGFLLYDPSSRATLDAYIKHIIDWGTNERLPVIISALQALRESGIRGDIPASPTIPDNEENEYPNSSIIDQEISDSSLIRSNAGTQVVPEPTQKRSKKRAADSQQGTRKRRKATGA
ncbi:unnamed protein product [Clonostachys rosea f. rosea IK726]|uniref:Uncharacterized protein n=1 Tax=Clonostachys rosea f. rosea IK726 TaxID=1349383 RepID=A0ACA9TWJ6_BIOOC|nr:unnamed protein product [Clonostachys rosea f. rosea IK726]